eukprot:CAMPEP_0201282966 /NCGR_PEP_ID=MMETSP1317-20130820/7156_1 /ASSEMBLY_ACC=CAM_ASM_000770 /TAXON_ID=187299 /ORGANISM="Undescribed Undescribed, Strain Undescribed" /LENGTH=54 /DNA_ID=CAMNT_0047597443 /DNA_START=447 /DNA_END=611 /DNA_ORIENTATION=-
MDPLRRSTDRFRETEQQRLDQYKSNYSEQRQQKKKNEDYLESERLRTKLSQAKR